MNIEQQLYSLPLRLRSLFHRNQVAQASMGVNGCKWIFLAFG
jgi:hypothetical protein